MYCTFISSVLQCIENKSVIFFLVKAVDRFSVLFFGIFQFLDRQFLCQLKKCEIRTRENFINYLTKFPLKKLNWFLFEFVKFLFFQICIYFSFRCTYNIHIFICYLLVSILYSTCLAILLTINFNYMWSLWMGFFSKHLWRDFLKAIQFLDISFWLTGWVNNVDFKAAKALQVVFGRII